MHVITVAFGTAPAIWQFVYKTEEAATNSWKNIQETFHSPGSYTGIADDFGQTATFNSKEIAGLMMEELELSKQAHIARSLHQQRTQAEFQKAAETDPAIRAAMRGPAVLQPMGASPFNGRGN